MWDNSEPGRFESRGGWQNPVRRRETRSVLHSAVFNRRNWLPGTSQFGVGGLWPVGTDDVLRDRLAVKPDRRLGDVALYRGLLVHQSTNSHATRDTGNRQGPTSGDTMTDESVRS